MGQMFAPGGHRQRCQLIPASWVAESTKVSALIKEGKVSYGYHCDVPKNAASDAFMAGGIYRQHIYVNTLHNAVVAYIAVGRNFRITGVPDKSVALFRLPVDQL